MDGTAEADEVRKVGKDLYCAEDAVQGCVFVLESVHDLGLHSGEEGSLRVVAQRQLQS